MSSAEPPLEAPVPRPLRRRSTPAPDASARARLTPERWIEAATDVLVDQGIDHVRVDVLSRSMGVTRGSFYWHFKDREDLLRRVLEAWRQQATEQLTRRLASASADPRAQIHDVVSLPFRGQAAARAARIELAIRAWARRDELARHAVDEADATRIGYHAQLFSQLGFAVAEARHRAFLLYSYEVAESLLYRQGPPAQRLERRGFVEQLLLEPFAAPSTESQRP